jgi:hypothetical protein
MNAILAFVIPLAALYGIYLLLDRLNPYPRRKR